MNIEMEETDGCRHEHGVDRQSLQHTTTCYNIFTKNVDQSFPIDSHVGFSNQEERRVRQNSLTQTINPS